MKALRGIVAIAAVLLLCTATAWAQPDPDGNTPASEVPEPVDPEPAPVHLDIQALATDRLPPIARSWIVWGGDSEVLGTSMTRVLVKVQGGELVLSSIDPGGDMRFTARGPLEPGPNGYVFNADVRRRKGMLGRLLGSADPGDMQVELRFVLDAERYRFKGETYVDGERTARPTLIRRKRALVAYSHVRWYERAYVLRHRVWTALYYSNNGYQVVSRQVPNAETMIAALEEAARENDPFDRVVMMGHGGSDGPVFGYGYRYEDGALDGTRQVSPSENKELWPRFVEAIKAGTTPNAIILASGCYTGRGDYVTALARETGRTVVGPPELTSVHRTKPHAQALEGEGEFLQTMVIARGDQSYKVHKDETLSDDPNEARQVVVKPPVPMPDDIRKGHLVYTYKGGWIDLGHAGFLSKASGQKDLIDRVLAEDGTAHGDDHYVLSYHQGMGPRWFASMAVGGVTNNYVIKKGLTQEQKERVALAIFQDVSNAFETRQAIYYGTSVGRSSFAEDDLVSNIVGFYASLRGLSSDEVMAMLEPATKEDSARLFRITGGPKAAKNRGWTPVDHNQKLGQPPMEFPELFTSIEPATLGGDWVKRQAE